jgi:hypothetical protein
MVDPITLLFGGPLVLVLMAFAGLILAPGSLHFYQTGADSDRCGERVMRWSISLVLLLVWGLVLLAYVQPLCALFVGSGLSLSGAVVLWLGLPLSAILNQGAETSQGFAQTLCAMLAWLLRGVWVLVITTIAIPGLILLGFQMLRYLPSD